MPQCYAIILCSGSSIDRLTNNWTLFNVVEEISVERTPSSVPLHAITFWGLDDKDLGMDFELRLAVSSSTGATQWTSPPHQITAAGTRRYRLRFVGVDVPSLGTLKLRPEWRVVDGNWTPGGASWPFEAKALAPSPLSDDESGGSASVSS